MSNRFTIDGSDALERHLTSTCADVQEYVQRIVPFSKLEAVVLGGGYGRGQGGVLKLAAGDAPYNDLEFYVFVRGNRLWNERGYPAALRLAGEQLTTQAGVHVEFKVDSLGALKQRGVSMFSYDLLSGHRMLLGEDGVFEGCEHHLAASAIPPSEGTRLLFNRCTGLLLAREMLNGPMLTEEQMDFIRRNIAKAELAVGDAVLAALGEYHWSCLERELRVRQLRCSEPWIEPVREHHSAGVRFKLHPGRGGQSRATLEREHAEISTLALEVWLWLERRRLRACFASPVDYALHDSMIVPGARAWRNVLLTIRSFGLKAALTPRSLRYPRERLFKVLPLLLWSAAGLEDPGITCHVQKQLETKASGWPELVRIYKQVWPSYG